MKALATDHETAGGREEGRPEIKRDGDRGERPLIVYHVFVLLHLDGRSLRGEPLKTQREALEQLLTKPGRLRQPVFLGLRADKPAGEVHRETVAR